MANPGADATADEKTAISISPGVDCAAPVILGLAVFVLGSALASWWDLSLINIQLEAGTKESKVTVIPTTKEQLEARFTGAATFLFFLVAGAAALAQSWRQVRLSFTKHHQLPLMGVKKDARSVILILALVLATTVFVIISVSGSDLRSTFEPELFKFSLGQCSSTECVLPDRTPPGISYLEILDWRVLIGNVVSSVAAVFIALGACCLVIESKHILTDLPDEEAPAAFRTLAKRWKNHLYFGSLFLVAGIFEMSSWRTWPAVYLPDKDPITAAFRAGADGTVLYSGLLFSITLFAIFYSASMIMNDTYIARGLEDKDAGATGTSTLKSFQELLSLKEVAKSSAAILAPVATDSAPLIVTLLTDAGG